MAAISNQEYADMILLYGFTNRNGLEAERQYKLKFPHRRVPTPNLFAKLYKRICETGSLKPPTGREQDDLNDLHPNQLSERFDEECFHLLDVVILPEPDEPSWQMDERPPKNEELVTEWLYNHYDSRPVRRGSSELDLSDFLRY